MKLFKWLALSLLLTGSAWPVLAQKAKTKPRAVTVELTGQVACSGCWGHADRNKTAYGTPADLECAAACAKMGKPALLAVRNWQNKSFTLYTLENGKFAPEGKNWLKYMAQQVTLTGTVQTRRGRKYLKVDALRPADKTADAHARTALDALPALELQDLDGVTQKLSDYRGQVVVLNFWAEWCGPCRKEMGLLKDFAMIFGPQDVQFIAASVDETTDLAKVRKFAADYELDFPVWVGATKDDMARFGFASSALPATVILDRKGRVAWRYTGVLSEDELRGEMRKAMNDR